MTASYRCSSCKREGLPPSDFPAGEKSVLAGRRVHAWCKRCQLNSTKRWRRENRPRLRTYAINRYHEKREDLKRNYGIDKSDYDDILTKQGGRCAICRSSSPGRKSARNFCVDHDHETQRVRGLLCNDCNVGISRLKEDPAVLLNAIEYLTAL